MSKKSKKIKPCHKATEIYHNLWVCNIDQVYYLPFSPDVLIPLAMLDGDIWKFGFRGEILYYPINDFETIPMDVLDRLVEQVINRLNDDKKVVIFCIGGHGRTGYIASCILGKLGVQDPIEYIRRIYCKKAIETNSQIKSISEFCNNPNLYSKHKNKYDWTEFYGISSFYNTSTFWDFEQKKK